MRDLPALLVVEMADAGGVSRVEDAAARQPLDVTVVDVLSPHRLEDSDEDPREHDMGIAGAALGAAIAGGLGAYWVQWWTQVASTFPVNAGARPHHPPPLFVPLTFETAVLFAAVIGLLAFFVRARMPRLSHPIFDVRGIERASSDRYYVVVRAGAGTDVARLHDDLRAAGALNVSPVPEEATS